jgi:pimeloyl-ACP methyl ester carboxylesterase
VRPRFLELIRKRAKVESKWRVKRVIDHPRTQRFHALHIQPHRSLRKPCIEVELRGESVAALIKDPPAGAPVPPILPPQDGFLFLDRKKFAESFAADVPRDKAEFMASSQVPWGINALNGVVTTPAWRNRPSWYLVATEDRMIPPPAQHMMAKRAGATLVEVAGSHAIYVSKPKDVAALIEKAAQSVSAKAAR